MIFIWIISAVLSQLSFSEIDLRTGEQLIVYNHLTGDSLADILAGMIETFVLFAPLAIVLVAMLGVGLAEHSGWIDAGLKKLLNLTPATFLTPMLILIAIISHTAADAGYVLVIPLE